MLKCIFVTWKKEPWITEREKSDIFKYFFTLNKFVSQFRSYKGELKIRNNFVYSYS